MKYAKLISVFASYFVTEVFMLPAPGDHTDTRVAMLRTPEATVHYKKNEERTNEGSSNNNNAKQRKDDK